MNRAFPVAVLVVASALVFVPGRALSSPEVAERDPTAPFKTAPDARAVVIEYFTASKNADAARASSLIDYAEWAKERGLDGARAKQWAREHRTALVEDYRKEKAAGSTKEFRIVKAAVRDDSAVFEVTQDRAQGTCRWEVKLTVKRGRWVIISFRLLGIER